MMVTNPAPFLHAEEFLPGVTLLTRNLPGSTNFIVRSAIIRGDRHRVVIDTLIQPSDMIPFADATMTIYTHSDWDHCWGTAGLPGRPVVGHQLTRERLQDPRVADYLKEMQAKEPEGFAGSEIILPDLTFTDQLAIDAGGLTLILHHLPGHTADSVVIHIPELQLLWGGDAVERAIPSFNETGQLRLWAQQLRQWQRAGLKHVIPSHGEPGGAELLEENASYIERLFAVAEHGLASGHSLEEIQAALPLERLLPKHTSLEQVHSYYKRGHLTNIAQVVAELQATDAVE